MAKQITISLDTFKNVYFIGIGGIGMSALARYFNNLGWNVAGYDKTETVLTQTLAAEGINITYTDRGADLPAPYNNKNETLIVYTPAIPATMQELQFVQHNDFHVYKRSQVLGMITRNSKALCVAGTHGKTTTSALLAHILDTTSTKCSAFLGGISTNFGSNFISNTESEYTVIEADEFDRSFLQLSPFASILTSTDADHLDIYGASNELLDSFQKYLALNNDDGFIIRHIDTQVNIQNSITYSIDKEADYIGSNLKYESGKFSFDITNNDHTYEGIELGIPGIHNAENAIACFALCQQLGLTEKEIRVGLATFKGVKRRFEQHVKSTTFNYIDDYAHHPTEISALIKSIRLLYPDKKITGIFQPHLFSRTRDFFNEFAQELSKLDALILMPIYPAREEPIKGVTSEALLEKVSLANKQLLEADMIVSQVSNITDGIVLTIGAGDIDRIVEPLTKQFTQA